MECGVIVFRKSLPFFGKQKLKRHILVNMYVIVLRATARTAPLVMKDPTFCWALEESRKVVASQIVIFRSIQILNSLLRSLKSKAYFSHLGIQKGPQIKIWLATRPVGAADLTGVYAARPNPVAS